MNSQFSKDEAKMSKKHEKVFRNANSNYAEVPAPLEQQTLRKQVRTDPQKGVDKGAPNILLVEPN